MAVLTHIEAIRVPVQPLRDHNAYIQGEAEHGQIAGGSEVYGAQREAPYSRHNTEHDKHGAADSRIRHGGHHGSQFADDRQHHGNDARGH